MFISMFDELKELVSDMTRTYSQMQRTDKYSQLNSIIWPVWLNGWMFVSELSGCGFESSCGHFNGLLFSQYKLYHTILDESLETNSQN